MVYVVDTKIVIMSRHCGVERFFRHCEENYEVIDEAISGVCYLLLFHEIATPAYGCSQ
ncbi:MAG: hypothetical protein IRF12RH_04255 [Rickettsia helvetica]|uniref:Uncharacterized protein n=1 Tax=Rickettsia helvetica TaxID=35789 RepID=A0ABP0T4M6_RICHE